MCALFSFKTKYLYFLAGQGRKSARRGKKARKFSDRGFSNVSLASGDCGDFEQIEAQKIILAASSLFSDALASLALMIVFLTHRN